MDTNAGIPPAEVQAQLERILASKGFAGAGRLSRLLRYLVERTLAGEGDQLKEYAVGVEAFGRDETYDPRLDSIVRVEAGRLRSKLDEYYGTEGAHDAVRISLPRGGYVPQFARRASARRATGWMTRSLTLGLVSATTLLVMTLLVIWIAGWRSQPGDPVPGGMTIAVLRFEHYSARAEDAHLAADITDGVTSELARLRAIGVASHTSAMQLADAHRPLKDIARALNADVVLEGSIREEGDRLRVTARLVDASTDRKVWVQSFTASRTDLPNLERSVAAAACKAALMLHHH